MRSLAPRGNSGLSSEEELIKRAQAGEANAFCLLAEAYERRIYSLAFHYTRERQDAEDLSQEVWLKAYAALATFRYESTFYTWLRKITINCFISNPSIKSSLNFLRKTPWAREKVELLYLDSLD